MKILYKLRSWANSLICVFLGHNIVSRTALPFYISGVLHKDVDAICLRCSKPYIFVKAITDSVFQPSPLLQRLRDKQGEDPK